MISLIAYLRTLSCEVKLEVMVEHMLTFPIQKTKDKLSL